MLVFDFLFCFVFSMFWVFFKISVYFSCFGKMLHHLFAVKLQKFFFINYEIMHDFHHHGYE